MKTTKSTIAITFVLALALTPALSLAGDCGSGASKSAASAETAPGIYSLAEQAGFTTLVAAVKAAGLDGVLDGEGAFTVFAPTDAAFAKLPEGTIESLLENPEQLKKILLYHVVDGNVSAATVVGLDSAKTLNGADVSINSENGVRINDASVIQTDILAANGTIHVIDTVLIPENI